jgi:predicted AAA+ superfamily ATPase
MSRAEPGSTLSPQVVFRAAHDPDPNVLAIRSYRASDFRAILPRNPELAVPRTVGKTQLMRAAGKRPDVEVFDLDDRATREAVRADPSLFASAEQRPVCFDEYQRADGVLSAIKAELNQELSPSRFLLAGSARHDAVPALADALTGRFHTVRIFPLSQGELADVRENFVEAFLTDPTGVVTRAGSSHGTRASYVERVVAGGFPIALGRTAAARSRWFDDMIRGSLERDLRELARLRQAALLPEPPRAPRR